MIDCKKMTWMQMSRLVLAVHTEMKRRNPIFINAYAPTVLAAGTLLREIAEGEAGNFSSECGPKEPKIRAKSATRHFAALAEELAFFDKVTTKVRKKR